MKNMLFTTATCPKCVVAKKTLNQKNIDYKTILVSDEKTRQLAIDFNIVEAPTLVTDEGKVFKGLSAITQYLEN